MFRLIFLVWCMAAASCGNAEDEIGKSEEATGQNLKLKLTKTRLIKTRDAINVFRLEQQRYPESLDDLVTRPEFVSESKWPRYGYLSSIPLDGWENELIYDPPGEGNPRFDLYSLGSDGEFGGEGYEADISMAEAGR